MTVGTFEGVAPLPSGAIVVWTGALTQIPYGFLACDGNNGTPDLRDRFIQSVPDASTDPGATGGENSKTLTESQLPPHSHTGSIDSVGDHSHSLNGGPDGNAGTGAASDGVHTGNNGSFNTSTNGSHSHTGSTYSDGTGNTIDNQPPYYEALYIQKI